MCLHDVQRVWGMKCLCVVVCVLLHYVQYSVSVCVVCVPVQTLGLLGPTWESSKLFSGQATSTKMSTSIKLAILAGLIFPMAIV